jgi:N-carbamoyl-L-amino-acid hydrolase
MAKELLDAIPACARRSNTSMKVVDHWVFGDERFDPDCVGLIRSAAARLGVPTLDLASQAGHDAYHIGKVAPMAMIFTPCHEGITHNNNERAELCFTAPGVNVLLHAVAARAGRA